MTVLVQLIGGQPLPNLLPVLHLEPDETILVCTPQTDEVKRRLESVIGSCKTICCDAYDIESLTKALLDELAGREGHELVFNLTGGTKAMVLAANQVALQKSARIVYLESERGHSLLYEYRYSDQQMLQLQNKATLPPLIRIQQFLDVHIGKGQWQETGPSKDEGGPFERAVAEALERKLADIEVRQGVRFLGSRDGKRTQADLDIIVRYGNQFARIECKSGGKSTLDAAKQLNLVTELLGTYTRKFIAMSSPPNPDHQAVYEATRTKVIELPSFFDGRLSEEDQNKLADEIARALGCKRRES